MSVVRKLALGLLVCAAASAQAATQSVAATSSVAATNQITQASAPAATSSSSTTTPAASSSSTTGNQAATTTTTTTKSTSSKTSATVQKVNINTADETTLAKVRGVGSANAKAIVAYRDNATTPHQFTSVNDLAKVPGVKISSYELKILAAKRLSVS